MRAVAYLVRQAISMNNPMLCLIGQVEDVEDHQQSDRITTPRLKKRVQIHVEKNIKNAESENVEVYTESDESVCGVNFEEGKHYLVFARRSQKTGNLSTSVCDYSRDIQYVDSAEIDYLTALSQKQFNPNQLRGSRPYHMLPVGYKLDSSR